MLSTTNHIHITTTNKHLFNDPLSRTTWVSLYRKVKLIKIYWSKRQCVAVASAEAYASLHLVPDRSCQHLTIQFLSRRCYASVGIVCHCVSVCVSHLVLYQNGCTDQADFIAYRFPWAHATPRFREIRVSLKIRVIPPGTLLQTLVLF